MPDNTTTPERGRTESRKLSPTDTLGDSKSSLKSESGEVRTESQPISPLPGERSPGEAGSVSHQKIGNEPSTSLSTGSKETTTQLQVRQAYPNTNSGFGASIGESSPPQRESLIPAEREMQTCGGSEVMPTTLEASSGSVDISTMTLPNSGSESLRESNQAQSGRHSTTGDFKGTLTQRLQVAGSIKRKKKGGRPRNDQKEREFESLKSDKETARMVLEAQALHGKMLGLSNEATAKAIGCKAYQVRYALKRFEEYFPKLEDVPAYLVSKTQLFSNIEMRLLKSISGKLDDGALKDVIYGFKEVFHANRLINDQSTANTKSQTQSFTKPQEPPKGSTDN